MVEQVPAVFRLALWEIKYDFIRDGASYMRMMNAIEYESPMFLAISDFGEWSMILKL
jgi:hypothetical protein